VARLFAAYPLGEAENADRIGNDNDEIDHGELHGIPL
jgi:hypothetical protein